MVSKQFQYWTMKSRMEGRVENVEKDVQTMRGYMVGMKTKFVGFQNDMDLLKDWILELKEGYNEQGDRVVSEGEVSPSVLVGAATYHHGYLRDQQNEREFKTGGERSQPL